MKVMQVINLHRFRGGADVIAEGTADLLTRRGHDGVVLSRDSRLLGHGPAGKASAFLNGIYSISGRRVLTDALRSQRPDLVHIHDVYPFFSPWVLRDCQHEGIPVVMTCHDYRLTCPVATHLSGGSICELCANGSDQWCVLKNCRGSLLESLGYALRSSTARRWRLFLDNVAAYITPTEFARQKLVAAGFPANRITAIPNMVAAPKTEVDPAENGYAAYVGRISPEKGVSTLLESALITGFPVRIAGDASPMPELTRNAPENVTFLGAMGKDGVNALYKSARFLVVPSIWYEAFGLVAAEAMGHGIPVIASNIGALAEVVDDGVTGLLFDPGNAADLADKMRLLWNDPELCRRLGGAARRKVLQLYNEESHFNQLMAVYNSALANSATIGNAV